MEVVNSLRVNSLEFGLGPHHSLLVLVVLYFLALDTHDAHEVVSRVGKLRALVTDLVEMAN